MFTLLGIFDLLRHPVPALAPHVLGSPISFPHRQISACTHRPLCGTSIPSSRQQIWNHCWTGKHHNSDRCVRRIPWRFYLHKAHQLRQNQAMKYIVIIGIGLMSIIGISAQAQTAPQADLQRITISAGRHLIDTQLAISAEQRATGLMFRRDMPESEGMLFVFEQAAVQCFWMKNTLLPLTAAFVADDGTIVNLADMKPLTTDSHCSTQPVRYVLEMKQGWFGQKGIKAGFRLGGWPFAPALN